MKITDVKKEEITKEICMRGYHMYKEGRDAVTGETLAYERETMKMTGTILLPNTGCISLKYMRLVLNT